MTAESMPEDARRAGSVRPRSGSPAVAAERGSMLSKMVEVLDLYSEDTITLSAEEIADRVGVSRPTAFRYVKELVRAGFLTRLAGRYALGARIIELDYRIRRSDPVLLACRPVMEELTDMLGFSTMLVRMYGDEIVTIHEQPGRHSADISFGRGRPLPLFRGTSKALVAHLGPARLRRLYERFQAHPDVLAIASGYGAFRDYFAAIRERGFYVSRGEIDEPVIGVGVPIASEQEVVASLSVVFNRERESLVNLDGLIGLTQAYCARMGQNVAQVLQSVRRATVTTVEVSDFDTSSSAS